MDINFKNGSKITIVESSDNVRGKRAELFKGFYTYSIDELCERFEPPKLTWIQKIHKKIKK